MNLLTKSQLTELRFALLAELVNAKTVALSAEMLLRRVRRSRMLDFEASVAQAETAIAELSGLGFVLISHNRIEDLPYYQASPAGVLAHEKGQ